MTTLTIEIPAYAGPSIPPTIPRCDYYASSHLSRNGYLRLRCFGQRRKFPDNTSSTSCARFRLRRKNPTPSNHVATAAAQLACLEHHVALELVSLRKRRSRFRSSLRYCRHQGLTTNDVSALVRTCSLHIRVLKGLLERISAQRHAVCLALSWFQHIDAHADSGPQFLAQLSNVASLLHLQHRLPP